MNENCDCHFCKQNLNEYFCLSCGYNFNDCEVNFDWNNISLCPKCHPKTKENMSPINFQLYEELPEPIFLQLQRQEQEKKEAEKKKEAEIPNIYYNQKYDS